MSDTGVPPAGGPIDPLFLLARVLTQKGNVSQSDLNSIFSPELAYLTGTAYEDPNQRMVDEELMFNQYAPNMRIAMNLPETDIRRLIYDEIVEYGSAPWDVKRQVEEYAAAQATANPATYNQEGETKDLMSFADTIFREKNDLIVQRAKGAGGAGSDYAKTTGMLPPMGAQFSPEELLPDYFSKYATESKERADALRKIQAPSGTTIKQASDFLKKQEKVRESEGGPSLIRRARGKRYQSVPVEQLAPYVRGGKVEPSKLEVYPTAGRDPEMERFANVAKSIVARGPQNVELSAQRAKLVKEQQSQNKLAERLGAALQQKAAEVGYTPAMVALLQRAAFLRSGGG